MKKQTKSFLSLYRKAVPVFPLLGIGVGIAYFLAMRQDFDRSLGYFARNSVPALSAGILTALAVICAAGFAFASRKAVSVVRVPEKDPLSCTAAILGALSAVGMLVLFLMQVLGPAAGYGKLASAAELAVVFPVPALLLTLNREFDVSDARAFFWIMSAGAVLLSMFACYFDYSSPLNSPVRTFTTVMQSALLLFVLAESRLALDPNAKKSYVTAPFQIFASAVSSSAGLGVALGGILDAFFGPGRLAESQLLSDNPNLPVLRLLLYFALGLFGLSRLLALPKAAGDYREPPAEPKDAEKKQKA